MVPAAAGQPFGDETVVAAELRHFVIADFPAYHASQHASFSYGI